MLLCAWVALAAGAAGAITADLDGDSVVGASDEAVLGTLYGGTTGGPAYDPSADLNDDGVIDVGDLAMFGNEFGNSGGIGDISPPRLTISLNDIPDDMNDLLVVPPERFQITLTFKSSGQDNTFKGTFVKDGDYAGQVLGSVRFRGRLYPARLH